jgi:class 3 adenylate cyclase
VSGPEREWFVERLGALGATPEQVDIAAQSGTLNELIRNYALWGQEPDMSLADIARELDVSVEKVRRVARAAGFAYDVDERVFVHDDVEMFTSFVLGSALFEPELLLRYSRMLGDAASRVADGSVSLFLRSMDEPAESGSFGDVEHEARAITATQVFRDSVTKTLERMLLHHFVIAAERFAAIRDSQHTVEAAVGFVDLTDSTGLNVDYGARAVEPALAAFEMTSADAASSRGGRLVKLIGDAAMFVTPDADGAVAATVEIVRAVGGDDRLRGARGGVAYGELLHRDGDYFGDPVNLAARLANAAPTGAVFVDGAIAKRIGDAGVSEGTRHLEGFTDPVEVFRVADD